MVAVLLLGLVIGLCTFGKQSQRPSRLSRAEKRELKRLSRKKGRRVCSKRHRSRKRKEKARLVEEVGIDQVRAMVQANKKEIEEQRVRLQAARDYPNSLRLVVDLTWAETLSDKELSSLAKQVCYVYGRVRAALAPPSLTLASYGGSAAEALQRFGACSWIVDRNPLSVRELFDAKDVVYLSPDADHPLEEVLDSDVYVVGGIVDRNHSKGLTLAAAEGARARALRLPFDEHLPEVSAKDRVLTVVACVGVLMGRHAGGTWKEVLERSLPRRGKGYDGGCQTRGGAWRGTDGSGWGPRENAVDLKDL